MADLDLPTGSAPIDADALRAALDTAGVTTQHGKVGSLAATVAGLVDGADPAILSDDDPEDTGTADPGVLTTVSRSDHVHAATLAEVLAQGNDPGGHEIRAATGAQLHGAALVINPDPGAGVGANSILAAGDGQAGKNAGTTDISGGANDDNATGGYVDAIGGRGTGDGGGIEIGAGSAAPGSDGDGGDLTFIPGAKDGAGRDGLVFLNLPTSNPAVAGALWNNAGTVKVSTG